MSSRSLNRVTLIGNLTRDPELRYTPQGTPVCTFGLATNRSWQPSAGGDRQEETEFHRIVSWNKLAELCSELLFKGRKTYVDGRLQTRNWTNAEGVEKTTVEIVIDNMIVLDSRRKDDGGSYQSGSYNNASVVDDTSTDDVVADQNTDVADITEAPVVEEKVEEKKTEAKKPTKEKAKVEDKVNPDDIPF